MANPNDNLRRLYQNGLKHFSLPDFDTFQQDMRDEEKRKRFYNNMQQAYSLPDFDTFSQDIGAVTPPPAQPQAQAQPQQTTSTVKPVTDNTAQQASVQPTVQTSSQPAQPEGWKPTPMQQRAFKMQIDEANARLKKQGEEFKQRMEGIEKGNRPGAFMGEREFNPLTGKMETHYYTTRGERVGTRMEQSHANTEYHNWWENNTEAGKRSKEQRLQREFDEKLSYLWQRHNPAEGENAAEQAWSAAESAYNAKAERNREAANFNVQNFAMNSTDAVAFKQMETVDNFTDRLTTHDMNVLMDNAWNNLGEEGQKSLIDDCYQMLRRRNPGVDDLVLYGKAKEFARQQSDLRMYHLAVEKNLPKSNLEYFMRKVGDMNLVMNIAKGIAVNRVKKTGDMAAYEAANEQYRQDGHKILDVAGTVTGFALDPTTWMSAGVGGMATRGAMWAGGRVLAGRGATAAVTNAATRQFATSMTGRVIGGIAGGAANFGTFEGIKEMETQFAHGGHIVGQDDTGRYLNEGYSASAVAGQAAHGFLMGGAIGWLTPVSGNVADKLVRSTSSTGLKVMERAGVYSGATMLEGTIFSVPEWIEGNRDAMDVWTDNMAMMVGFKAKHMIKSAGGVLGDLKASFDSPTNGSKNRLDFESRLRQRMDAPSDGGLALTKDEQVELQRYGYDLRDLVESAERTGNAKEGGLIAQNAPEIVSRLTDMVTDPRISEAARAKMYYYATGRKLPVSTVMKGELIEDGEGGFIVESQGANGVITSRSFKSRKAADLELERIKRQTELNHIEIGERYQQTADFENRLQEACRTVAAENGWDMVEVYRTCEEARRNNLRGGDKQFDEAQQNILRKVTEAMGEFEETSVTDNMRGRINDKYGVDIDNAIRKEANRRTIAEQTAIDEYLDELIPKNAKERNTVEDAEAEDITNQKLLTDEPEATTPTNDAPIDPRFDNPTTPEYDPHQPGGEQKPVGRAVMKYQDRPVEVLSGRVVMMEDGTMIDNERSDASIVVRDLETGKVEMVSPDAILSYEGYPAEVEVPQDNVAPEAETPAEPQPKYTTGQIKIRNSDGTETRGVLTGFVDENGNHEYYVEGDLQHLHYASEHELDNILSEYTPDEPQEVKQPQPAEPQPVDPNRPTQEGVANVEDYDKGYSFGIDETQGISDSELTAKISELRTDAERLTDFGRGMLEAYEYEQQRRAMEQQLVPVDAETVPKTEETTLNPMETGVNITETVPKTEIPIENVQQSVDDGNVVVPAPATNEAPQVDNVSQPDLTAQAEPTPLQRIPRNEKNEPIFEQAESPEVGWDALVEFSEGDAATAKEIADTMVEEKRKAFEKAQKLKPKGKTPTEILASKKANTAELTKAQAEYEQWQRMAGVENARQSAIRSQQEVEARRLAAERAEAEKAEREAREEAARLEREALEGIPEWHMDTPENARKRGVRRFSGQMFTRQEPVQGVVGNEVDVKFSQKDLPKGRVAVIEASQLQPSHVQGQRNPMFFIEEAQPKNRAEAVSMFAAKEMAEGIRPKEITGSVTAYTGAPTVNTRGEVIQGNNRSDALRYLWQSNLPQQQQTYKQYLIDNAEQFGIDPEAVNAMQNPVLVNMLDVDDAEAIRLGQMTAQDTESGGIERIKPKNVAQTLGDNMRTFANMLLSSGEEDVSFGQLVDRNGTEVMKWMNQVGAISNTQFQSAFDSKSNLTAEAKNDLQKVLYQAVFKGASQQLEEMFDKLPAKAQRAILATAFRDMDSPFAGKMLPEIQASIIVYNQLMSDPTFANAKKKEEVLKAVEAFKQTIALDDRFEHYMPADNFSNFALHLAAMYKATDMSQATIASYFNQMYDLAQGKKAATLFDEADTTEYPLAEVINQVLNFEYQPAKNGNNDVANGGADVALRNQVSQGGELRGNEPPASGEQTPTGTEPSDSGAGASDDSSTAGVEAVEGETPQSTDAAPATVQAAVEAASAEVNTEPTPAQAEAGNYKKGHITIGEFDITIENPAGSVRKGIDADGKEWSTTMANTYGYIKGTEGVDGDHIDVFLHENMDMWNGRKVYVVDQTNTDGSFDEHKVMLGFNNKDEAMSAYLANYDATWGQTHPGLRISETNIEDFNKWVQSSHRKTKPFADYSTVSKITDEAPVEQPTQPAAAITGEGYKVEPKPYTNKQGKTLDTYLVTFDRDFSKEELSTLRAKAKALKGWYDRETRGWMLRSADDAKAFAKDIVGKSEDEVADEAPLSLADMEKPASDKPKKAPVNRVNVEGVMADLSTKGETKLSDHADPVEPTQTKPKKRRWISDEDADEFNNLRDNLRNHFGKGDDIVQESAEGYGKPQPKQMDAEVLRMGTRMTYLMMKGGLRSFADYCEAMIDELPDIFDDMRPHLKSLYAAAQNMEEVIELGWDEEMDDRKTVKAFDVYNFDKPGAKDIIATSQHIVDEQSSQQHTDQIIQTLKDQRNEQRKKEADETSADTEAIADKAEAVASKVESELEVATTEQDAERLSRDLDKEIEDVNKQLALLGYYEAVEDDSKFHESYGYMLTAEKKAVSDATNLAKQIVKDLGIDIKVTSATTPLGRKNVKKGTTVRANLAPAGGEIYITLPLNEGRHLKMYIGLEPVAEQDSRRRGDNLKTDRIMYRVEWPDEKGYVSFERIGRNCWAASNVTYDELLTAIRREARNYLPEDVVKPATPLTPQPGEDMVQMAERVAKLKAPKKSRIPDEQPMNDLFGGLFDEAEPKQDSAQFVKDMADMLERGESPFTVTPEVEAELAKQREAENNSTTPKNNSHEKTDVQARPETAGRGGQQPRPNEPLGTSAEHEAERTDGGRMAQRGGEHTVSDTKRGTGVSEQHKSERGVAQPKNIRNNHAERGVDYAPKGEKARIDANLAAIEVAKKLLASGETATPKEMEVLRRYSGWGGLGSAFNEGSTWSPNPINKRLREILTPEEYEAAVMSRNSAYYTPAPVIDAMWDIAKALGFKGGNIVEGSAGIGNIIGLMPTEISERSNIHAVEIDNTTGGILSLLYPDAKVEVQGFEKTRIANGSVDLAITNVPFVTGLHVMDESGDSDLSKKFRDIHDFCIAKNVRKLREGGIGIFITSSGTLDKSQKLRNWLVGDKEGCADVVGVFRMNNQTFGGTAATSDIIVVRKRVNGRKSANAIDISTVTPVRTASFKDDRGKTKDLPMLINRYFIEHPEYMGGEMFFGFEQGDTYRPTSMGLFPTRTADQPARLAAWVQHLAEMDWSKEQGKAAEQTSQINEALGEGVKEGSMVTDSEGNLCVARMGRAVPLTFNKNKIKGRTKEQCFADYTDLKNALADVLKYQTEHNDDAGLQPLLDRLNSAYDTFVARYGNLNKNNNLAWLRNDVDFSSIVALETYSEKGSKDGTKIKTYGKTDIFSRRVVEKESEPAPKNVKDGIIASLYKYGRIDPEYLASQLGKSQADVKQEIIESGLGFENPTTGQMEVSYEYLSGNVREKLRQAREANEAANGAYDANIKALEAVVPMNIPAHLIEFTLGSSWVDPKLYERFVKERTDLNVRLTNAGGTWHMSEPYWTDEPKNKEMGIRSESLGILIPGHKLIEAAITNKTITVSKTTKNSDGTTTTETDAAATTACATKVDEIRQDFKDWAREQMQNDPELSMRMEEVYNEKFNNSVPKSIPDEFVPEHFGGAATMVGGRPFRLRPHQAKAVIRATTQPVLLAHEVGTGKTYTLITTAMEMRRLGTARKPMIVVQNATVGQFVASAKALYPNAKVLTLEDADRNAEGRKAFYAKIKFNDWDMIVVPQSVFERIPDSVERQTQFIQDKIEEKLLVLDQMKDADPDGRSMIVRAAEREIEKLKDEISQLANGGATDKKKGKDAKKAAVTRQNAEVKAREMLDRATDDVEDFDSMGIDAILVDEAHEYKHLGFATAMQRGVKGVDPSFSKKSQGVFLKTQSVLEKTGGKNVVFATGTPISNTAAEIWTFMRYLMSADVMKDYGIYYFDDFVRNFGNLQQMLEFSTSGKYKENNRFAGYVNLPELVRIWSTVADTVLTREAGGVSEKIPQLEGGKVQDIILPQTRALRSIMKFVKEQLDAYDNMSGKEKKENSHIPLVMYRIAKAAAVDARLVQSDAEDDPNSKTNEAVRQTLRTLEETKDYNGTVTIFADNYQNKVSGFNLYEDIRKKLISAGVPEEQIVVMKRGMTVNKKLEIFSRVNAGEVRVIMGSTFTLGTGVNIQERHHTLIHLDAPNRPMDYTQRNGRILRQGNLHNEWGIPVRVLRFGVEDSLDVTAYQRLKTKGAIADSIMNGKQLMENSMENRTLEEDQDLFGDITAQLSGSEYAMLKNQIEKEVRKLTAQRKSWEADQIYIHNRKRQIAGQNKEAEKRIAENKSYLEKVEAATVGDITVDKLSYPSVEAMEDFFTEQNKRKAELQEQVRKSGYSSRPATSDITISVGGFNFHVHTEINRETKQGQQGDLFYSAPAKMTYSCPELGIEAMPVKGNVIKNAVTEILNDVVSGEDFRGRIEAAERSIERNNAELQSISARDGVPFKFTEELAKAEEKLSEYEDLMKAEMEAKEAKYAELDKEVEAASNIELTEEDSEDAASEPIASYSEENANFASRYETQDGKTINYTSENAEGYGGLFDFDFSGENAGGNEVGMRSGANDLQRQGDTGLNRHNSRLDKEAGEFSLIERVFIESGSFNFTSGEKIESADDVAFIFSALEDAAKEHSFVVLVKDGKPTVVELGMGTFTATMVDIPTTSLAYNRIQPDQVYFVHNHPGGNLMCSPQDVQILRKIADISKVPVHGVIINLKTGKYGTFDTDNTSGVGQKRVPENESPLAVHTLDKQIFAPNYDPMEQPLVRGSEDVAKFLNSQRMGDRAKMSFIILSRAGRIVGNIHTPFTKLPTKSDEIARYISERVIQFGGESAILYGDFTHEGSKMVAYRNLKDNLNKVGGTTLLDVVNVEGNNTRSAKDDGLLYEPGSEYGASPDSEIRYREVEDDAILTEFAEGKTVKAYRTMQVIDGRLYSPMATKVGGKTTPEIRLGVPEQSEEHPEIIKGTKIGRDGVEQGYVVIDKGLGKGTLTVAYNPYAHTSRTVLNDQFSAAYIRPNLVTVEVEVPESELTSGYRAHMAKDAVGEISWHSGSVSGQLAELGRPRRVILTRYDRPVRIVPFREVAQMIAAQLDGTDIAIPYNVVQPQLRTELERLGVAISEEATGTVTDEADFGKAEYVTDQEIERINARQQEMAQTSPEAKSSHAERMSKKFNTPIRIVTDTKELTNDNSERQARMRRSKGFYDPATGEVVIVLPNNANVEDVAETVFHEVVAHKGLREMIGEENYDAFCDEIYNHLKDDLKQQVEEDATRRFVNEPGKEYEHHRRVAVDEMFGRMSEKGFEDFTKAERGIWVKLKAKVLEAINKFLGSLKLPKWVKLGDNELRYMLWRSHEKLRTKGDYVDMARDAAKREELGLDRIESVWEREGYANIEVANKRFNEELTRYQNGEMKPHEILHLGYPRGAMRNFLPNLPIVMRQRVIRKGSEKKHDVDVSAIMNMPNHLASPIFIFQRSEDTIGVLTDMKDRTGKNVCVAIELKRQMQNGDAYLEVNDVRSFHGRDFKNIVEPIVNNHTLRWVDKSKGLAYLSSASQPVQQEIDRQVLEDAAKVIKNFENPLTDDDLRFRTVSNGAARREYDERVRTRKKENPGDKRAEKRTNHAAQLHEAYMDGMRSLRVLQEAVSHETGSEIESHEDAYEYENQLSSRNKSGEEEYKREYMKPMFDAIAEICSGKEHKRKYGELIDYVLAKHGLERNAFMRAQAIANGVDSDKADATDYAGLTALTGEQDVADAEIAAAQMVRAYEAAVDTSSLWKTVNAATKAMLTTRYTSGLLSRDMYDTIRTQYKNYIPLKGWEETVAADVYEYTGGGYGLGSALMKAYGRSSVADDPFATIVTDAQRTIMEANRNIMKQRFLNLALNHQTDLLTVNKQWYVRQADGSWLPDNPVIPADADADLVDAIVKQHEADMLALESVGDATKRCAGLQLGLNTVQSEPAQHMVKVKRNGEEFCIYVNGDPRAARAINGMLNPDAGEKTKIAQLAQEVKNFMSRAFTTWNPEFIVGNLSRDLMFAGTAVTIKEDARYARKYAWNITNILAKASLPRLLSKWEKGILDDNVDIERYFKEFLRNGGETGFTQLNTVDKVKKEMQRFLREAQGGVEHLPKKAWRSFWNGVEFMNRAAEDTTRFGVYMTSRQSGRTISRSISDAKEITVNFNRKGSGAWGARQLNFLYVFFNACMQAMANAGRLVKNNPVKSSVAMASFLSAGFLVPMVSAIFASLFGDEEDDYWNLPEWVRRNNICIYVPFTKKWLTIPIAHELRPFYGIGEIAYSTMNGKETTEDAVLKGVESFSGIMPIDWTGNGGDNLVNFAPTIVQPLVQVERNVDYFGKPIYKKTPWNENDPEWSKAYKGTNGLLVDVSKMLSEAGATTDEFGVTSYPQHWYSGDINPAIVEHLLESYSGGVGKTVNGFGKTISMLWNEDARELRNVPVVRKFLQSSDERAVERRFSNEYFKLRTEYEDSQQYYRKLCENARQDSVLGAAGKISKWLESEQGQRHMMLRSYMLQINRIENAIKQSQNEEFSVQLRERADSLKKELVQKAAM